MLLQSKDFGMKTAMSIFVVLAMLGSIVLCTPQVQGQEAPPTIAVHKYVWAKDFFGGPEFFQTSEGREIPRVAPTDACNGIDFFRMHWKHASGLISIFPASLIRPQGSQFLIPK